MLLPQSEAFKTLHARLASVPTQALLQLGPGRQAAQDPGADPSAEGGPLDCEALVHSFRACLVGAWLRLHSVLCHASHLLETLCLEWQRQLPTEALLS